MCKGPGVQQYSLLWESLVGVADRMEVERQKKGPEYLLASAKGLGGPARRDAARVEGTTITLGWLEDESWMGPFLSPSCFFMQPRTCG